MEQHSAFSELMNGQALPEGWRDSIALTLESIPSENGMGQHYVRLDSPIVGAITEIALAFGVESVLELGCGRGACSQVLARAGVPEVWATDINSVGLDELRTVADEERLSIHVERYDAASSICPKAYQDKFDVVIAKDVYPFMTPDEIMRFIENASRAVRPGGILIITAPSPQSRLYDESIPRGNGGYFRTLTDDQKQFIQTTLDHFSFASEEKLTEDLAAQGLCVLHTERYGRESGWVLAVAQRGEA